MYIYLVFSRTGTLLSRVLERSMKSKYVHVSISLDENLKTMYSFGRVNPDNPFSGGFVRENLGEGVFSKRSDCECVVYRLKITTQQYSILMDELERFLEAQCSYKYNFLGLFAAKMNISLKRENYYFCSQFVSELLIKMNVLNTQTPPEMIKPTDLLNIETKEEIFKGFVWEYRANDDQMGEPYDIGRRLDIGTKLALGH